MHNTVFNAASWILQKHLLFHVLLQIKHVLAMQGPSSSIHDPCELFVKLCLACFSPRVLYMQKFLLKRSIFSNVVKNIKII
jgi:hypothetical protein